MSNAMQTDSPYECAQCHLGFTSLRAFDTHQEVMDDGRATVKCHEPEDVGLIWQERDPRPPHEGGTGRSEGWRTP